MEHKTSFAGNYGNGVKSDCQIFFEPTSSGKLQIELLSKVEKLYGDSIQLLLKEILRFFEIEHARIIIKDCGALDFVIAARLEAAIKTVIPTKKDFLPEIILQNKSISKKDCIRHSRLYLPGNTPKFFFNAAIHKPDGIILDLEDSVAPNKKFEAKFLVRNALRSMDFLESERMVRINQIPAGIEDLAYIVPHYVNLILIPKIEDVEQINAVETEIIKLKKQHNINQPIWLMPIIESAKGVINAYEIASASENIAAMAIGLEDYTADLGVKRTNEGTESFLARSYLVNACKAAGVQAIDSVFSDVGDMEALREAALKSRLLGFDGMGCIHPRQIKVIKEAFSPTKEEIEKAQKIVEAYEEAQKKGLGVVALGTKMIDAPVVKRALRILGKRKEM